MDFDGGEMTELDLDCMHMESKDWVGDHPKGKHHPYAYSKTLLIFASSRGRRLPDKVEPVERQ